MWAPGLFTGSMQMSHLLILSGKDVRGLHYLHHQWHHHNLQWHSNGYVWPAWQRHFYVNLNWNWSSIIPVLKTYCVSDGPASAAFYASYELIQRWLQGPERWVVVIKYYLNGIPATIEHIFQVNPNPEAPFSCELINQFLETNINKSASWCIWPIFLHNHATL